MDAAALGEDWATLILDLFFFPLLYHGRKSRILLNGNHYVAIWVVVMSREQQNMLVSDGAAAWHVTFLSAHGSSRFGRQAGSAHRPSDQPGQPASYPAATQRLAWRAVNRRWSCTCNNIMLVMAAAGHSCDL